MKLFDGDGGLEEDVEDILYELGNVGVGMVSTTIGQILGVRAEIGIPIVTKADMNILEHIEKPEAAKIGIYLNFASTLSGAVMLLLDMKFIHCIVEKLINREIAKEELLTDEESTSAIGEFANIIVASYMNAMGSYTGIRIFVTPVSVKLGMADNLIGSALEDLNLSCKNALCVDTGLSTIDSMGNRLSDVGHFIMMPDELSVKRIVEAMGMENNGCRTLRAVLC